MDASKFEEYKTLIEDTARFSERRQNVSNLYITINSLLLTAIMFALKDAGAGPNLALLLALPILVAGIFVCRWWEQLITKYKELVGLRITVLREMEESEHLAKSEKIYHREDELYPRNPDGSMKAGGKLNFSDIELQLPKMFLRIYLLLGIVILIILLLQAGNLLI